jgi:transcription elongation factor Elf1
LSVENKHICWFCNGELIWGCDFDYEDYGLEGDGIVATLSCKECEAFVEFYSDKKLEEKK